MDTVKIDTDWFRSIMEGKGLTVRALGDMLNLPHSAVSLMLRGKRKMQLDEVVKIANALQTSVADVLEHAGIPSQDVKTVVLLGTVDASGAVHEVPDDAAEWVECPRDVPSSGGAYRVDGGTWLSGAMLFTGPEDDRGNPQVGRLSVVKPKDHEEVLARVLQGKDRNTFALKTPDGVEPVQNSEIEWHSPVLWIRL